MCASSSTAKSFEAVTGRRYRPTGEGHAIELSPYRTGALKPTTDSYRRQLRPTPVALDLATSGLVEQNTSTFHCSIVVAAALLPLL